MRIMKPICFSILLAASVMASGGTEAFRPNINPALQQGRPADACDDLVAAFTLGRNASRDGTLISLLVQIAMEAIVCSSVAENFYEFPPDVLQRLMDGLDAAPVRGMVAASVPVEK